MAKYYIKIKECEIPVIVRNYKNTNSVRIYFKGNILNISKYKYMPKKELMKIIKQNEKEIYTRYMEIISKNNSNIKHWYSGEKISYKGEDFTIIVIETTKKALKIELDEKNKEFKIAISKDIAPDDRKNIIDKYVKKFLCIKTREYLDKRLPYWSKKMEIGYNNFQVRDATSKYGSCIPKEKRLHFSNRLIMLPEDKIDAIIVHELSHMIYANHSKQFYALVQMYINNYFEIDKWLKENVNRIMI